MLSLLPLSSLAQIEITPIDPGVTVYPGDVVEAKIHILDDSLVNNLRPAQIRKWGDPQVFLFMTLSPWQKDSSGWHIQSKVVLGPTFSADKAYAFQVSDKTIEVRFKGWMWNPQGQQIDPKYDYEDIPLFSRSWFRKNLILVSVLFFALIVGISYVLNSLRKKKKLKNKKIAETQKWLRSIREANSLQEMSQLWVKRDDLKLIFPQAEAELRSFFDRLNMYQFRPSVADAEVQQLRLQRDQLLVKLREVHVGV
jgi:hypothetical protein